MTKKKKKKFNSIRLNKESIFPTLVLTIIFFMYPEHGRVVVLFHLNYNTLICFPLIFSKVWHVNHIIHYREIFQHVGNTVRYTKCHYTSGWIFEKKFFQPYLLWHLMYQAVFLVHKFSVLWYVKCYTTWLLYPIPIKSTLVSPIDFFFNI